MESELLALMAEYGVWTPGMVEEVEKLEKSLEDLKVSLYENWSRSNARLSLRAAIRTGKEELARLESIRHSLDHVTADGLGLAARFRYLTGACLMFADGTPYWPGDCWDHADLFIDNIIEILARERIGEDGFRDLARNDPWKTVWSCRQAAGRGIFDASAVELSDEQRSLVMWSMVYDNVREYPNVPPDAVIADDDCLDGWMILQRRNRETQIAQAGAAERGNKKIQQAEEVFMMANNIEEAREIEKMNNAAASVTKAQRMAHLKNKGIVHELDMPDKAMEIMMARNRMESAFIRGK
jgi:hypothetical protein